MSEAGACGGCDPDPDFTAGPFVTRHDRVHQPIETISGLYLDLEDEVIRPSTANGARIRATTH